MAKTTLDNLHEINDGVDELLSFAEKASEWQKEHSEEFTSLKLMQSELVKDVHEMKLSLSKLNLAVSGSNDVGVTGIRSRMEDAEIRLGKTDKKFTYIYAGGIVMITLIISNFPAFTEAIVKLIP